MNPAEYSVVEATSSNQLKHHYQLRYRVFCEEKGFEPAEKTLDGLERDAYDSAATPFLVQRRPPGRSPDYPATFRWLPGTVRPLPVERVCQTAFPHEPQGVNVAELSRFIIRDACLEERFNIFAALVKHCYHYSRARDMRYLLLLIRPALLRILHYRDVPARPFSKPVQFRGTRIPCYIDLAAMEGGQWDGDAKKDRRDPQRWRPATASPIAAFRETGSNLSRLTQS